LLVYDGSIGEGGGSILRLVTSLALVTQESVKIINIRKNRPKPGLKTQHLVGLRALAEFCGGELEGDTLGSEVISFIPSDSWNSKLKIRVTTAGSLGLILQSLQVAIAGVKNHTLEVEFQGGATFGKWAPSIPYVDHVTWEIFRKMNFDLEIKINRHGFYPKGGAQVLAKLCSPPLIQGLSIDTFTKPKMANILSFESKHLQRARVAERQTKTIVSELEKHDINSKIINESVSSDNAGSGVLIYSKAENSVMSGDFVGERRISAEKVGQKAFKRYFNTIKKECTVDPFLADQILPIMATASSSSIFLTPYLSDHTKTNMKLIKDVLDVEVNTENIDNRFKVSIDV
jgi:RNA 3'-terminal phosphate cyclase (ATP)